MPELAFLGVARLLSIVTWVSKQENHSTTIGELADHYGRSLDQIERDVNNLTYFRDSLPLESFDLEWYPLEGRRTNAQRREQLVTIRQPHGFSLPAVFDAELASRALVGLRVLSPLLPEELRQQIPGTLMALERMRPGVESTFSKVDDLQGESSCVLPPLQMAISDHVVVEFVYERADGMRSSRRVLPRELTRSVSGWVLSAVDVANGEDRSFVVGRVSDLRVTDELFAPGTETARTQERVVRVRLRGRSHWLANDYASVVEVLEPSKEGEEAQIVADIPVWNEGWVRDALIAAGSSVLAIEDTVLAEQVRVHASKAWQVWSGILEGTPHP